MIISDSFLFSEPSLDDRLRRHRSSVEKQVNSISKEQFLANSDEQVIAHVFSKMEISPLAIFRDNTVLSEPSETQFERQNRRGEMSAFDGVETELSIPYLGDPELWKYRPSTFTSDPPRGDIVTNSSNNQVGTVKIRLFYSRGAFQGASVNQDVDGIFASLELYIGWIKQDIEVHNQQLKHEISHMVQQRREHLGAIQNTLKTLNIPIVKKDGAPNITELPIRRRTLEPLSSQPTSKPEYGISNVDYEHILNVIRHEGISFERTPQTFSVFGEEGLRDILLAHLNSHFQGQATGETFRKKGKTDICIEFENRAAFVAECKLWKGEQILLDTANQLLGYLTWRDVKAALVIFNKDVSGFKQIQDKILGILRKHANCASAEFIPAESEWRMILRSKEDSERFITVRVFLFNLYIS